MDISKKTLDACFLEFEGTSVLNHPALALISTRFSMTSHLERSQNGEASVVSFFGKMAEMATFHPMIFCRLFQIGSKLTFHLALENFG